MKVNIPKDAPDQTHARCTHIHRSLIASLGLEKRFIPAAWEYSPEQVPKRGRDLSGGPCFCPSPLFELYFSWVQTWVGVGEKQNLLRLFVACMAQLKQYPFHLSESWFCPCHQPAFGWWVPFNAIIKTNNLSFFIRTKPVSISSTNPSNHEYQPSNQMLGVLLPLQTNMEPQKPPCVWRTLFGYFPPRWVPSVNS